jgi:hypothetical protein
MATNGTGGFVFFDVEPGNLNVAFKNEGFHDEALEIRVGPETVTHVDITMLPSEVVGPGYRTHLHDFWAQATEIQVMDRVWEWNEEHDTDGPYAESGVQRPYNIATQASVHACAYGAPPDMYPYFNNRIIWFDEPTALV